MLWNFGIEFYSRLLFFAVIPMLDQVLIAYQLLAQSSIFPNM
jgi:hypothetical protein